MEILMTLIGISIFYMSLVGYSSFFQRKLQIEFSHACIFSIASILSIYLVTAILFCLDLTIYISFTIGVTLFCYYCLDFLKQHASKSTSVFTDKTVYLFFLLLLLYYNAKNCTIYYEWDEYSLWGILIKEMNINHGLRHPGSPTSVIYYMKHYTQLPTIFYYSMNKLLGAKISTNIFANGILYIIWSLVSWRKGNILLTIALQLIIILPTLFSDSKPLTSIYTDLSVGCVFGSLITIYIQTNNKYNPYYIKYVLIMPIIFILPNIKEVGYWFSCMAVLFILSDVMYNKRYRELKWCVYLLSLVLLSKYIWYYYVNSIAFYDINHFLQIPFISLYKILLIYHEKAELIKIMIKGMSAYFYSSLVMRYIYCFIIINIYFLMQLDRKYLAEYLRNLSILLMGFCLYIVFRMDLYISKFTINEAKTIAGCYRYFDTYVIVFAFLNVCYFQKLLSKIRSMKKNVYIYNFLTVIFSVIAIKQLFYVGERRQFLLAHLSPPTRLNRLNALIQNNPSRTLDFTDNNFDQLDCYIFNYIEAPYTREGQLQQCLEETTRRKI